MVRTLPFQGKDTGSNPVGSKPRTGGRVVKCGGLLSHFTTVSRGSNPLPSAFPSLSLMVEQWSSKPKAAGSSPAGMALGGELGSNWGS